MFNGYNAAPLISYNEFDQDKERKGDNVSKWSYGHDSDVQPSSQSHSGNRQAEYWSAKPNFSGIPNVANVPSKCNCSGCYTSSENQSYQGDTTRHRPWLPRTFSVPSNESCKLPGYHHLEGVALPNQAACYSEGGVPTSQFLQENGGKHAYYRHYQNSQVNQPGVITSAKKDVLLKQKEEICSNLMGQEMLMGQNGTKQPVFPGPGYNLAKNVDKRMEGRNCSSNVMDPSEKYANVDSYRYPANVASYPLDHHISRLPVVEPYIKAVPSNFNQNRVPSTGHRSMKEELPQSYINQYNDSRKIICSEGNQTMNGNRSRMDTVYQSGGVKEGAGSENFHSGQMHGMASPMPMDLKNNRVHVEYPNFGRDPTKSCENMSELEAQKLIYENKRHSEYYSRNNYSDLIKRNNLPPVPDNKKDCAMVQNDQINMAEQHYGSLPRPPNHVSNVSPKYLDVGNPRGSCRVFCPKDFNADATRKPEKFDHLQDSACFQRSQEVIKNGNVNVHARLPQPPLLLNDPRFADRAQNSFSYQSNPTPYRNYVRSEYSHQGYNAHGRYDNPNVSQGVIGFQRNDLNQYNHRNLQQPMPAFSGADQFMPHASNSFVCDPHYQQSGTPEKSLLQQGYDGKNQTAPGVVHTDPHHLSADSRADRLVEVRKPTYLDTVRSEEVNKNGTSKISPLRLLRKKKFINQGNETFPVTTSVVNSSTDATPALDVRKFWSTWAEEEEENVAPTQVVVLDCQNIDPEQAKLLNLYDSDPVRAVQLENGNIVTVKGSECGKESTNVDVNANVQVKVDGGHFKLAEEEKNNHQTINKNFYENQIGVIQQEEPIATRKSTEDNLQVASSDNVTESSGKVLNDQSSVERPVITESATQKPFNEIPLGKNESKPCKRVRSHCSQDNKEAVCHKKINLEDGNRLDKWTEKKLDFLKRAEESKAAQILKHEEEKKKIFERRLSLQQSSRCDLKKTSPNAKNESLRSSLNCPSDQDCNRDSEHEKVVERLSSFDDDSQSNSPNDVRADLSDLPTSEFRRNKFLDYSGREIIVRSGTSVRVKSEDKNEENSREVTEAEEILKKNQVLEIEDIKNEKNIKQDTSDKISWPDKNPAEKLGKNKSQSETPAVNLLRIKEETGFRSPETEAIVKKFGRNFRSPEIKSEIADESKNQVKKKMMAQRHKAKKAKKLDQNQESEQSTNELTVQNISMSKPTIKFSIQKSHDLKISFKVLNNNNNKKLGFDEETGRKEVEDKTEEPKNSTELITLKLKRIQRDGSSCDRTRSKKIPFPRNGDLMKKSRRRFRRKKLRGLSPMKTPILKIKKSSYMQQQQQEKDKDPLGKDLDCDKCLNLSKKLHPDDGYSISDDFQVQETVDSAKIKLTFKRQKSDCETEYKINNVEDEYKPEEVIAEEVDKAYWKKLKRTKNRNVFAEACFESFKSEEETSEVDFYAEPESKEDPLKSEEKCLNPVSPKDDDELKPTFTSDVFSPQEKVSGSPTRFSENVNFDDWKTSSVHEFEKNILHDGLAREVIDEDRELNANDNFNEATGHECNGRQGRGDVIAKDVANCDEDNQPVGDCDDHNSEAPVNLKDVVQGEQQADENESFDCAPVSNEDTAEDFWDAKVEKSGEAVNVDSSTNQTNHSKNINSSYEYKSDEDKNIEKTYPSISLSNKNSQNEESFEKEATHEEGDVNSPNESEDHKLQDPVDACDIPDDCPSHTDVSYDSPSETVAVITSTIEDLDNEIVENINLPPEEKKEPGEVQNNWNLEEKITDAFENCMEVDIDLLDDEIEEVENPNHRVNEEDFQSLQPDNDGDSTDNKLGHTDYHSDDINNNGDKSKEEDNEIPEDLSKNSEHTTGTVENVENASSSETNLECCLFQDSDSNIEKRLEDETNASAAPEASNEVLECDNSLHNCESQIEVKEETFEEDFEESNVLIEQNRGEITFSNSNEIEKTEVGVNDSKNIHTNELLEKGEEPTTENLKVDEKAAGGEKIKNLLSRFLEEVKFDKSKRIHRRHSVKIDYSRMKLDKNDECRRFKFSDRFRHSKAKSCPPEIKFSECEHKIQDSVIDVPVEDIPLPPGEPPPENCFDFEAYFKKLRNQTETHFEIDSEKSKSDSKVEEELNKVIVSELPKIEKSFRNSGIIPKNEMKSLCALNTENCRSPFMSVDLQSCRNPSPPRNDNRELTADEFSSCLKKSKVEDEVKKDSKEQATDLENSKGSEESEERDTCVSLQQTREDHDESTVLDIKEQASSDGDRKNFEKKSKTNRASTETEIESVAKDRKSESKKRAAEKLNKHDVVEKAQLDDLNLKGDTSFKNDTSQESDTELKELDPENVDVDAMTEVGFENGFSRDGFYECEDIPTSEDLPIGEDIEVEKVSDDDKFRNIMQNCLDNAKKFLNVGNLKLFSCSVDDLLELDCQLADSSLRENEPDKSAADSTNHISRDVLLTSCEDTVGDDLELSEKFQPAELSMDFVPSFCSDASNNLCPEILPVDNWPYLEEEVPLSPTKPKPDEADLIPTVENLGLETNEKSQNLSSSLSDISFSVKNNTRIDLNRHKSRRVSLPISESVGFKRFRRRSLMVDGETLRMCSRINRQRRTTIESFTGNVPEQPDLKNESNPNNKLNKLWQNNKSLKCRLSLEKIKNQKYQESECKIEGEMNEDLNRDVISNGSISMQKPSGGASSKSNLDYKSATFQPKVMLFRISKNKLKRTHRNSHSKSEPKSNGSHHERRGSGDSSKRELPSKNKIESDLGSKHIHKKHKSSESNQNKDSKNVDEKPNVKSEPKDFICNSDKGKIEEDKISEKSSKEILEILSRDDAKEEKLKDREMDSCKESKARKRKKSRFRNLHTCENQSEPETVTKDVSSSSAKDFSMVDAEKVLSEIFKDCDVEKDQDLSSKTKNKKESVSVKSNNLDEKVEKSNGDKCTPVKTSNGDKCTPLKTSFSKNSEDHVKGKSKSRSDSSCSGEKNRSSGSRKDDEKTHAHRSSKSKEDSSRHRKTESYHSHRNHKHEDTRRKHEHERRSKEKTRSDERERRKHREKDSSRSKSCDPSRKRSSSKEKHSKVDHSQRKNEYNPDGSNVEGKKLKSREASPESAWVCEVCGFNDASERIAHIKNHPFHCQSCHLAFKTEAYFIDHLTGKHKDIRNQHHCLLCELSFDTETQYQRHLETREHTHLESVEKNTINTLFTLLTGQPCPVLGFVEMKPEWLPNQAGTVHFYHQATPLSLALQYLKMHHDLSSYSSVSTAHP